MTDAGAGDGPIAAGDVEAAGRVLGVAFTAAEREQMARGLGAQVDLSRSRRRVALGQGPVALRFDPRMPGFRMPAPGPLRVPVPDLPLPEADADIAFAPVTHLAGWVASGRLTSERLTRIYLDRIAASDGALWSFATVTPERAMAEARAADAELAGGRNRGPLHGIPYGLKDLFDTAGVLTAWGAEPYRDRVPETDAAVVLRLREAGAVLLGKTSVGALAYGDIWMGQVTRNPWHRAEGSSGSSAGSAAAVAAGLCAFAVGTETLGSITSPSQRCGTTGLRPTFGRVSRAGCMSLCPSLDKVGPIARGVEDAALVLGVLNGGDPEDRGSIDAPFGWDAAAGVAGLRLGYLPTAFGEGATEVDRATLAAAREIGVEVVECALPELPYDALFNVLSAEAAASFEELTLGGGDDLLTWQDDDAWPNTFRKAWMLSAVDHVQLDRLRYRVMEALDRLFRQVDAVIGPLDTGPMMVASNFTGHPCLHLRAGFLERRARRLNDSEREGAVARVPSGISLWGRLFDEGTILSLGLALERRLGVAGLRPPGA
jgi:Asp-tRNA(Asn)/Glu-tRNA(Gln) amidotransferase A subunit family amidase